MQGSGGSDESDSDANSDGSGLLASSSANDEDEEVEFGSPDRPWPFFLPGAIITGRKGGLRFAGQVEAYSDGVWIIAESG
jgi:hypothetical protein